MENRNKKFRTCPKEDCIYHTSFSPGNTYGYGCDYAAKEGRSRLPQIPREEWPCVPCRLYVRGQRKRIRPNAIHLKGSTTVRKTRINWEYAEKLWNEGKTDREIAELVGAGKSTVEEHRRRWGQPNPEARKCKYDIELMALLYEQGKSKREIAQQLGCTAATVRKYVQSRQVEDHD